MELASGESWQLCMALERAVITITITSILLLHVCALKYMQKCVCVQAGGKPWVSSSKIPSPPFETGLLSSLELITFETGWPVEPQTLPVSVSPELALQARASVTGIFYMGYGYQTRVLLLVKVSSVLS